MRYRWLGCTALAGLILVFILFPAQSADGAKEGLRICGTKLVPALLPFLFLMRLLTALLPPLRFSGKAERVLRILFGIDAASLCALLFSLLGGYPGGVAGVVGLYQNGSLGKKQAENTLVFCNNSGPAFFTAVIGVSLLNSVKAGLALYGIHCVCALLCARVFYRPCAICSAIETKAVPCSFGKAFQEALLGACTAMLQIATLVILFSVPAALMETFSGGLLSGNRFAFLLGLSEVSSGIVRLSGKTAFVAASFLMGWGGLCVHLQATTLWQQAQLRPCGYYAAKLLHGLLSAVLALAVQMPNAVNLASTGCLTAFCVIYPAISKKWGGNLSPNAV